jgi:isoquinoline 1-oxidoreductase alpha subunit
MPALNVNGTIYSINADPSTPLLWLIRDIVGLKGTKYSCGIGVCGACTVLVSGKPGLSCQLMATDVLGQVVTTIEGLSPTGTHPLQEAWIAHQVPQCGFCQPGQILCATQLVGTGKNPTDYQINTTMNHLCVCGTYSRMRAAIHTAAAG